MSIWFISLICIGCMCSSFLGTKYLIKSLTQAKLIDLPNSRSNHSTPTPRGGGLAIIIPLVIAFIIYHLNNPFDLNCWLLTTSVIMVSVVSFIDDKFNIPILIRFATQAIAVIIVVVSLPCDKMLFQGYLPLTLDRILGVFGLLWFTNLFNFMDGIDGIAASEAIHIPVSLLLLSLFGFNLPPEIHFYSLFIICSVIGFLYWNWHPAKIFMGDVGSITLGFLLGWLLFLTAVNGYTAAALIIPAYFVVDSTLTLLKRLVARKKIWQAHSEHFYQIAVRNGTPHNIVVKRMNYANLMLICCALLSKKHPISMVLIAAIIISLLLWTFYQQGKKNN